MRSQKSLRSWIAAFWAIAALCWIATAQSAAAQQIWFGPIDNLPRGNRLPAASDFPELFSGISAWPAAEPRVDTLVLTPYYISYASDQDLQKVVAFTQAHKLHLNIALQALPVENCGHGVEGLIETVQAPVGVARRLKKFGAKVDYFSFDEPLQFGHFYNGPNACRYSIGEVAQRLAQTVKAVQAIYPQAQFVDYEVPTQEPAPQWSATLDEWLKAYRAATGISLYAFVMDVDWRKDWRGAAEASIKVLQSNHVRSGIFIDATGGLQVTDSSWMTEAKQNIANIKQEKLPLDFVLITSWMGHPSGNLPDNNPLSLTYLINWYSENGRTR